MSYFLTGDTENVSCSRGFQTQLSPSYMTETEVSAFIPKEMCISSAWVARIQLGDLVFVVVWRV